MVDLVDDRKALTHLLEEVLVLDEDSPIVLGVSTMTNTLTSSSQNVPRLTRRLRSHPVKLVNVLSICPISLSMMGR